MDKEPKTFEAKLLQALSLPTNCTKAVITLEVGQCMRAQLSFVARGKDLAKIKNYEITAKEVQDGA